MDVSTALTTSIRDLLAGIGLGERYLDDPLRTLVRDAGIAVPSFLGLQLTMAVDRQYPVRVSSFGPGIDGEPIATSLRLPLAALGQPDPGTSLSLYAATAGAFVDLAADLSFALRLPDPRRTAPGGSPAGAGSDRGPERIILDQDLVPMSTVSGVFGVAELTVINQAIGILIDHGHEPRVASAILRRRAAAAGLSAHPYAVRLVRGLGQGHGPG